MKKKTLKFPPIIAPSTCIPMERMNVHSHYAFTFNPSIQPDAFPHLSVYVDNIKKMLLELQYCNVILFPEMSHKGRWHYHGYIQIISVPSFFMEDIPLLQKISQYEIDSIGDYNWALYVMKCQHYMTKYCEDKCTPYLIQIDQIYQKDEDVTKNNEAFIKSQLVAYSFDK